MTKRSVAKWSALVALVLANGCSEPKVCPVNGRVKFQDGGDVGVLAGYSITFESDAQKVSGFGEVQADGTFAISTYGADDGAVPGRHRIAITPPLPEPEKALPPPAIAAKYGDLATSGLTADIKPGTNQVTLELERAP